MKLKFVISAFLAVACAGAVYADPKADCLRKADDQAYEGRKSCGKMKGKAQQDCYRSVSKNRDASRKACEPAKK
ncbi:MAG: hypothetical protein HY042_06325 [Spirochaetia bacterium]|nr:hypothetical protein [Spirochaetia bacterium]